MFVFKGSLSPLKNENKLDEDFYCTLHKFVLIRFIQRHQGHRDSVVHQFHSNVNKVNKAVAKVRTIGDRLPLNCWLRDSPLSAFANHFELRCEPKQLMLSYSKICPCFSKRLTDLFDDGKTVPNKNGEPIPYLGST